MVDIILVDIISFPVYYFKFICVFVLMKRNACSTKIYIVKQKKGGVGYMYVPSLHFADNFLG